MYLNHKNTVSVEHSRQVKVFVPRIFGIVVEDTHKLAIAFLFENNHSTWLFTAILVLRTIRIILEIFVANLNIALGVNPFVSNGEPRLTFHPCSNEV